MAEPKWRLLYLPESRDIGVYPTFEYAARIAIYRAFHFVRTSIRRPLENAQLLELMRKHCPEYEIIECR